MWPAGCIREHHLVDASGPMTVLSEFLLSKRGEGAEANASIFPGVRHRRFLPSVTVRYFGFFIGPRAYEQCGI